MKGKYFITSIEEEGKLGEGKGENDDYFCRASIWFF